MNETQAHEILLAIRSASFDLVWWSYVLVAFVSCAGGFFGAYVRKRGELLAQKEDFERILDEQRQTTKELERIRDEITRATWHRTQVWTQRRDVYAQLLPKLNKVIDSFWEVMTYGYDPTSLKATPEAPRAAAAAKKLEDSLDSWMEITGISEVFLGAEANAALREYKRASSSLNATIRDSPVSIEYFEQNKRAADKLYMQLIAAAKADLGIVQAAENGSKNALQPTA